MPAGVNLKIMNLSYQTMKGMLLHRDVELKPEYLCKKRASKGRNIINQALDYQTADSYRQYDIKKLNN